MEKRVYELASLLGTTNNQMLKILWDNGIEVSDYTDLVDYKVEEKIRKFVVPSYNFKSHKNKSSLKYIKILGLFGKKDYKISFDNDINIFIAENGFGKTTILNILVASLQGDKKKLSSLPFEKIVLGFKNESIELLKEEFNDNNIDKREMRMLLKKMEHKLPYPIYNSIYREYVESGEINVRRLRMLIKKYSYNSLIERIDYEELDEILWRLDRGKYNKSNPLKAKFNRIAELIGEEILYFPTYRRIEEELDSFIDVTSEEKRRFKSSSINFGMNDVETVITELTNKLKEDAIHNYSIMNGQILDDLLTEKLLVTSREKIKIDSDIVKIIIGRIGENRIKQLDKLMDFVDNNSEVANKTFLEYYLYKLISIYENQKPIDEKIKKYRDVCNCYLVNKEIVYDEVVTEVSIQDKNTKEKIDFRDLSSGEKQILSLFCKLYLNTSKPVIFIIDEPELSLSIIWQKRLIEDIYESGRIALLISTTHSPYIFKNNYRNYAKELEMFEENCMYGK